MAKLNEATRHWKPHSSGRCMLLCVLIAAAMGSARAQDSAPADLELDVDRATAPASSDNDIIVTGSRIPRSNLTAISPVTVVDGKDVGLQGAVMTEDLLNALPQVVPDQGRFLSNDATGTATVDLRGAGPGRTLVLINGRRLLPGDPFYPAPDINAVPSALIKRVEVLTGGASSVYGSDAITGVVNFILETQLEGLRVEGQASVFQHDNRNGSDLRQASIRAQVPFPHGNTADGGTQDINAGYGFSFADDRGHVTAYAGYRKLSALTLAERDYSACATIGHLDSDILDCGGSEVSEPGTFFTTLSGPFRIGSGREFVEGITRYNYAPLNYYQRPDRRYTAGAFADFELSRAVEPFIEFMFMDDRTTAQVAPSGSFYDIESINCDNPLLANQQRNLICFTGNFVGETPIFDDEGNLIGIDGEPEPFVDPVTGSTYFRGNLFVARRNVEGGPRISDLHHQNLRILAGLRGELSRSLTYEASVLFGKVKYEGAGSNDFSIARIRRAVDVITDPATGMPACRSALTGEDPACVPWDIFAPSSVTPEAAAYPEINSRSRGSVKQHVATAFVNFSLENWGIRSPWADEAPSMNVGFEYRKDELNFQPDAVLASADIAGGNLGVLPVSGSTKTKELFVEARISLIENRATNVLTVEAGYRQSWQSNSENKFRFNTYKLGLEFAPVPDFRLRASLQSAVRAPNVQELFTPTFQSDFRTDPCAGVSPDATLAQCENTGVNSGQYGRIVESPNVDINLYNAIGGGNPALDPEKATTKAVGLVLRPRFIPGLDATIDWFDISLKGTIGVVHPIIIMNVCIESGNPLLCGRIHRDANGSLWQTPEGFVDIRNINFGSIKMRGVDVGVSYRRGFGRAGSFDLELLGSQLYRSRYGGGGPVPPFNCAGAYGLTCGTPRPEWRHKARATWKFSAPFSLSLQWRHVGSVRLDRSIPGNLNLNGPWLAGDERIGAQNYFDLTALARVSDRYEFRIGVTNLFDREPPIVSGPGNDLEGACAPPVCNGNTFPEVYDPLGRFLFAGFTVNFD